MRNGWLNLGFSLNFTLGALISIGYSAPVIAATPKTPPFQTAETSLPDKLKDFPYWSDLCNLQADSGQYETARRSCEQGIILRPKDAGIWADHSGVLLNLKQYPEAIASADKALKLNPKNSLALAHKCLAFAALKRPEEALDYCAEALRVNGSWGKRSPALAWVNRGLIFGQTGQLDQALIAFDRALLLQPNQPQTLAYKCDILIQQGQPQKQQREAQAKAKK
jgi:tetratricopeptide (TPR) repeat protein